MAGLDASIILHLENQCKALPPGVEIEVQKRITKEELKKLMKKVWCELDIHKWKVYILKPNNCLRQAETYGLSTEDVRDECDIINMKKYKLYIKLKKGLDRYLKLLTDSEQEIKYHNTKLKKLMNKSKKTKEDLVKIKKNMDTFKWTSYYKKVYEQYVALTKKIEKTQQDIISTKKYIDRREKVRQENLGYYNLLKKKAKEYIDKLNKYHTE